MRTSTFFFWMVRSESEEGVSGRKMSLKYRKTHVVKCFGQSEFEERPLRVANLLVIINVYMNLC